MEAWLKELRSMWVISYDEGEKIGTIAETYLDTTNNQITGFLVKTHHTINNTEYWLPIENVKKIGKDVFHIAKASVLLTEQPKGIRFTELVGMKVDSKDGNLYGALSDLSFNRGNHVLKEIFLNNNQAIAIELSELVLGKDVILVHANATTRPFTKTHHDNGKHETDFTEKISKQAEEFIKQGEHMVKEASDSIKKLWNNQAEVELKTEAPQHEEVVPSNDEKDNVKKTVEQEGITEQERETIKMSN